MPLRSAPTSSQAPLQIRILLVDGNPSGLAARKTVLEEQGYKVWVASNSLDAFDEFSTHKFDLVVTDHKMPRMDGLGLIKKIQGLSPSTPIVLLSGFVDALGLNEYTTGASAVIQKSAHEVPHLVRAVARLLKRKPVRSESRTTRKKSAGA